MKKIAILSKTEQLRSIRMKSEEQITQAKYHKYYIQYYNRLK